MAGLHRLVDVKRILDHVIVHTHLVLVKLCLDDLFHPEFVGQTRGVNGWKDIIANVLEDHDVGEE